MSFLEVTQRDPTAKAIGLLLAVIFLAPAIYYAWNQISPYKDEPDAGVACSSSCCDCARACQPHSVAKCGTVMEGLGTTTYCTCK